MNKDINEEVVEENSKEVIDISLADQEDVENLKVQMTRYQPNKFCYWLGMLGILCSLLYLFPVLNNVSGMMRDNTDIAYFVGIKVVFNIAVFLLTFLSVEKMKAYDTRFSIVMIVLGGIMIARIFIIPTLLLKDKYIGGGDFAYYTIILCICSALYIFSGIVSYIKSTKLHAYLKSINALN